MFKKLIMLSESGSLNLWRAVRACVLSNLSLMIPFVIILQLMGEFTAPLLTGTPLNTPRLWLLAGLGFLGALAFLAAYKSEYKKTYDAAYQESMHTRVEVAEHMRRLPLSFFNRKDLSELTANIMADCTTIEMVMSHVVPQMLGYGISSAVICLMLAFYDWRMALAVFCALPLAALLVLIGRKAQNSFAKKHVAARLAVSDQVQEYLDGIKVVKAFGLGNEKFASLKAALREMMWASIRFEALAGVFVSLASMLLQVGIGVVVLVGVNLMAQGSLSPLVFLAFVLISAKIYGPLIAILTLLPEFFYLLTSTERMRQLRREPIMDGAANVNLDTFDIVMDNATFAYNDEDVISNLSCVIPQGKITALVGPSGSGKSTVSRLIARFWDVKSGRVTVGGRDVASIEPERLMNYMAFVFQDVLLFDDSILNNIRLGRKDATDEEIFAAARAARCEEFIQRLPDGWNSVIGENGCTLSGGERQRISIARALLKNAPIVLLDEATASLDPENEVYIQEAISELVRGRTVIVIAHRLRTIREADQVIVLENGRLAECGPPAELLRHNGLFARLFALQQENMGVV